MIAYARSGLPGHRADAIRGAKGTKVPPWLRKILLRGLSMKPEARYPTIDALAAVAATERTTAPPAEPRAGIAADELCSPCP